MAIEITLWPENMCRVSGYIRQPYIYISTNAWTVNIRHVYMVKSAPAAITAPDRAQPSSGKLLTTKLGMFPFYVRFNF